MCIASSMVIYDAILVRVASPDDRDRVSSRGWAFGYLGGGLLLAANLGLMTAYEPLGLSYGIYRLVEQPAAAFRKRLQS